MSDPDITRRLLKAANLKPFNLNATEVQDLLDWFGLMPPHLFNELYEAGVPFPEGYIQCWKDLHDEEN